jgi:two-component system, chemotaxis family, chemotaxis protein CheY
MLNLLIADQSDVVRKVGKRLLAALDFNVSEAGSADDAIFQCIRELPDVMIVDAGMSGALDLITYVRSLPGSTKTRIYYCVIETDLKKMMAGKRAGANDFLLKPFDRKCLSSVFNGMAKAAA